MTSAPPRLRKYRLTSALRRAAARLALLCLHATGPCLLLGYILAWAGLMVLCVEASGPAGAGLTTAVTHCLKLMLYVSVATAAMVGPVVVPLIGVVRIVREEEEPRPPGAVPLERTDAPELWRLVADLDLLLGTPGDTRIWLTACVNAEMGVRPLLGRPRSKTLYLGAPLLAGVDREELRAVLCHELAHCAGRHHGCGALAIRTSRILRDVGRKLPEAMTVTTDVGWCNWLLKRNTRLLIALFGRYRKLHDRLSRSARHRQELEADRIAALYVGRASMRRALLRAAETAVAWEAFRGTIPRTARSGWGGIYRSLGDALPARTGHPSHRIMGRRTFSHPALGERLAALGPEEDDPPRAGEPGLRLLSSAAGETGVRWPKLPRPDPHAPATAARTQKERPPVPVRAALMVLVGILSQFSLIARILG
ncbi:M48 family metalloprotease [Streptomyces castrisilvae]|uniref:M48 family metalloprotease n=1 Tax=Streptomyces castrisilvae TaxID=3033811 RepID=A0ABY9HDR8_9ACTN|nr:M48 family metallopeptidase [Streptomyces sp. Mut1]WLQ32642.1 M48 family metalloprotease [Streptomyces sp. Mut1]